MSKQKLSIIFIITLFFLTIFYIPRDKSLKVINIITPCEIELNNKVFKFNDEITCFDTTFTEKNKKLAKKFNISEEEAFILGNLGKYWAENTIKGKNVFIKNNDIIFNKYSYKTKFLYSGFAICNSEIKYKYSFDKKLKNIRKGNYRVLNLENNEIYKTNNLAIKDFKKFLILNKYSLPKNKKNDKKILNSYKNTKYEKDNLKIYLTDFTTNLIPNRNCNTEICKEILNNINNAKNTIDIAIYGYSKIPSIENALIDAQKRGVKIRLVYDVDHNGKNIYPNTNILTNIIHENKNDQLSNEARSTMHNKFYIFDKEIIITGSANLSHTDMSNYNSNSIISIKSKDLANTYTKEFEQMFNGNFHNDKISIKNHSILIDNIKIQAYFSPKDKGIENALIPIINHSTKYIYIPIFVLTEKKISEALINAKKRNVDIKIIMDSLSTSTKHSKINELRNSNIEVKTENYAGKMHSKTMIVDDKYTIIGSMNFSNSGENKNDENFLIIENAEISKFYKDFFLYQWNKIDEKWLKFKAQAESKETIGSCHDGIDNDYDGLIDTQDDSCK